MKIFQAHLLVTGDTDEHCSMDVIEHDGKFWLVPDWLEDGTGRVMKPVRIVSFETMDYERMAGGNPDFFIADPVPRAVVDGCAPPEVAGKYVVIEDPDIFVLIPPEAPH